MRYLIGLALLCATSAHAVDMQGLVLNGKFPACDTQEQMNEVVNIHLANGQKEAQKHFNEYQILLNDTGEPTCGLVDGIFFIADDMRTVLIEYNEILKEAHLVHLKHRSGQEFYAVIMPPRRKLEV